MFGNSASAVVMRLDQNGDITISKKMTVGQNAVITTLEVNQTSYLKNTEIDGTLKINNINTDTLYQTRAWISIRVFYSTFTNSISSVIQSGRVTATVSIASGGFSVTFAAHPNGDNYIAQFCLIGRNGYIFQGSSSSTAIFISTATTDFTQQPISFNLTIF